MSMNAKLNEFQSSSRWWLLTIWGNGHTGDTDPTQKGWRAAPVKGSRTDAVLVGRRGVQGCFSVRRMADGWLDVAIYDETPEEIARCWRESQFCDAIFKRVAHVSGWGLEAIALVEADQANAA